MCSTSSEEISHHLTLEHMDDGNGDSSSTRTETSLPGLSLLSVALKPSDLSRHRAISQNPLIGK